MAILDFDYMDRPEALELADRKLQGYIMTAAVNLRRAEDYAAMELYADKDFKALCECVRFIPRYDINTDSAQMSRLYYSLVKADMKAARALVSDLEDVGLLDLGDWAQIDHWLVWFGISAEGREPWEAEWND